MVAGMAGQQGMASINGSSAEIRPFVQYLTTDVRPLTALF
jgi:hypothetical protein